MTTTNPSIARILVKRGEELFQHRRVPFPFTSDPDANRLLNDLSGHPHAFVIACIMDRQVKSERAWLIPHAVAKKIGGFEFRRLARLKLPEIRRLLTKPEPLHRFPETMAKNLHAAVSRIGDQYGGNASGIWRDRPSSAEVVYRLLQFDGVGPKIATLTANLLARQFKIRFSDYYSVDLSADVHVRRVFGRLGLTNQKATNDELIYRARSLSPQFPGLMDSPTWEIGRTWCHVRRPNCQDCYMSRHCRTGVSRLTAEKPRDRRPEGRATQRG